MSVKQERRDFIGLAFGAVAAVGGALSLVAVKKTWDPLPSVRAGATESFDLSPMKDGEMRQIVWRKQPIFVLRKDPSMPPNDKRDVVVGDARFIIAIGLCTHLGCIPQWQPNKQIFFCACHAGEFNADGVNTFGPPSRPLDIPPFKIEGMKLVLGETGPEYEKLVNKA